MNDSGKAKNSVGLKPALAHSRQAKFDRLKLFDRLGLKPQAIICRAYVQFRGNEFHTRNARSRQLQEQRRAKAQR